MCWCSSPPAGDEKCDESLIINALGQMQLLLPAQSAHSHNGCSVRAMFCVCVKSFSQLKRIGDCVISQKIKMKLVQCGVKNVF